MIAIDALGPTGEYRSRNRELIADTAGVPVAELTIAPKLYVARALGAQRKIRPLPAPHRQAALVEAADAFLNSVDIRAGLRGVRATRQPRFRPADRRGAPWRPRGGRRADRRVRLRCYPPARRARPSSGANSAPVQVVPYGPGAGDVFAVHASGNAPGVHALWPQALALGYRVAVRPSRREPFTGQRLVYALRQSGFRDHDVMFLPTDYAGADELIDAADLAMVYGGQDIVDKYADDPTVFVNGPGRTKILITEDRDWRDYIDVIVDSIAHLGGMACVNATAVLCEGDAAALAHAIAEQLSAIVPLSITDERAVLPTQPLAKAQALADYLATKAAATTPLLGADQVVADLGDGHAALRPAVHLLAEPDVDVLNVELAFPCVWVSPWSRDDGLVPLRHSLVVNAITSDEDLVDDLVAEPSITNVYSGHHPTYYTAPGIPHDGFLADFLMRCKGFVRD